MSFLLDTNIISELRKSAQCNRNVWRWHRNHSNEEMHLSVLTIGELRKGIENCRAKNSAQAHVLEQWLESLELTFGKRIVPITLAVADLWGRMPHQANTAPVDGLIAATATYHNLTVVSRNERDFQRCGVDFFNPFRD